MRWIPAALMLAVPLAAQDERPLPTGNVLREWRCDSTKLAGEQYRVIRDPAAWEAFWKDHDGGVAPKVDFEREMVVAAAPAEAVEVAWARTTRVGTPGRSKFWVGLCPSASKLACHVAVLARSDLAVELWLKDPSLAPQPGQEIDRGGFAVDPKLVRGSEAVWPKALPKLTDDEMKEARAYLELLDSNDVGDREQGQRGLLRFGARARPLLEPLAASSDPEAKARAEAILEHLPTFDAKAGPLTREYALFLAREHVSKTYPTQFTNDPDMRWEEGEVRVAGGVWRVHLRYL